MATDATGAPTTLFSIPKFNVNADAPSGLGGNAQMDAIDALIANLGIAGLVASDVPVYDAVAGKFKKATGTPSVSTFLRGDGSWGTPTGIKTVSAYSGGPPGTPADGDTWLATDAMATGNDWLFRYRSADTYWHFIGGAPVKASLAFTSVTSATTWTRVCTQALRGGDWNIGVSQACQNSAGNNVQFWQLVRDNRSADLSSASVDFRSAYFTSTGLTVASEHTLSGVVGSADLYWQTATITTSFATNGSLFFTPIRIQ